MFNYDNISIKDKVTVTITLANGNIIHGCFFTAQGQRLLELMNDKRTFIPIQNADGSIIILQKTSILQITPINEEPLTTTTHTPGWDSRIRPRNDAVNHLDDCASLVS